MSRRALLGLQKVDPANNLVDTKAEREKRLAGISTMASKSVVTGHSDAATTASFSEHRLVYQPEVSGRRHYVFDFDRQCPVNLAGLSQPVRVAKEKSQSEYLQDSFPTQGAGSVMGQAQKEEAKRRRIMAYREKRLADHIPQLHLMDAADFHMVGKAQHSDSTARYYLLVGSEEEERTFTMVPVVQRYRFLKARKVKTLSLEDAESLMSKRATPLDVKRFMNKDFRGGDLDHLRAADLLGVGTLQVSTGAEGDLSEGDNEDDTEPKRAKTNGTKKRPLNIKRVAADVDPDEEDVDNLPDDFSVPDSDEELPAVGDDMVRWGAAQKDEEESDTEDLEAAIERIHQGKAVDEDEEAVTTDTSTEESDEDDQEEDGKETKEELGEWEEGKQELAGEEENQLAEDEMPLPAEVPARSSGALIDTVPDAWPARETVKRKAEMPPDERRSKKVKTEAAVKKPMGIAQSADSRALDKSMAAAMRADVIRYLSRKPMMVLDLTKKLAKQEYFKAAHKEGAKKHLLELLRQLTVEIKIEGKAHRKLKE